MNILVNIFKVDNEVKHIKLDNMEQKGYEFEMGRIQGPKRKSKKTIQKEKYFLACNGMDIFVSNNDNLLYSKIRQNREEKEIYYNNYFVDYIFYDQ